MVNVVYQTSGIRDWVDVAENLKSEINWEPTYWLVRPSLKDGVKSAFPDVIYHRPTDASRGVPSEEVRDDIGKPVDKEILERYREYEPTVLKMMDRQDTGNVTGDRFGYNERKRLYTRLLMYWESVIQEFDIDVAVFMNPPHMIFDYILYAVCVENELKTAMFTPTRLPNTYYVRDRIHRAPDELSSIDSDEDITREAQEHLEDLRSEWEEAKPSGFEEWNYNYSLTDYLSKLLRVSKYPWYARFLLGKIAPKREGMKHYKEGEKMIENSSMNRFQSMRYNIGTKWYNSKLADYYNRLTEQADTDNDYVFYALHYQPERTTCPDGGVFVNQYLAVRLLADCLPEGWRLYVKEHPNQTSGKNQGEMGRRKYMYDDLDAIDEVTLIGTDVEPFRLIDGAHATATITGTAGWESINRGVPAIVFGSAWYRDCPGCIHAETHDEVKRAIQTVRNGFPVKETDVLRFVNEVEEISRQIYINSGTETESISRDENVKRISDALVEWWNKNKKETKSAEKNKNFFS